MDLIVCQTTPAPIVNARRVVDHVGLVVQVNQRIREHDVVPVQGSLLFVDPAHTFRTGGSCCIVASLLGFFPFPSRTRQLMIQALAEVLQVRVSSDLKTSHKWGS